MLSMFYLDKKEKDCGMQYVGQTSRFLNTRFTEHYGRMKKPHKIDNFLCRHF